MSIGIIGGTGLYDLPGLDDIREREVKTPFGNPSSPVLSGVVDGVELHFLARHGRGHTLLPSEVNYRANLYALKVVGAKWCLSVSAVGSLQEEFRPGQVLVPDQFIDRTKGRASTFFGEGIVGHVAFADPFCPVMREELFAVASQVAKERSTEAHNGGTYLCMEGPAFSTRAESHMYRSWGASIIGMTNLPEAKLAREAEIAYATLALITDYDCWRSESDDVDIQEILRTLNANADLAKEVILRIAPRLNALEPSSLAANALQFAIITQPDRISADVRERLRPIIGKYI
ncbi:MAG: S-methyl-5'-thioadenosine phosphorylase [Bdellovibrionales bacterium]|nr:S-methyl-5'-thioadenosine phosphorylase [Bdellovibrionales bacterium]